MGRIWACPYRDKMHRALAFLGEQGILAARTFEKGREVAMLENELQKLREKLSNVRCPMCGKQDFSYVEGYFSNAVQPDKRKFTVAGKRIPAVVVICNNCGFMSQHACGVLDGSAYEKDN